MGPGLLRNLQKRNFRNHRDGADGAKRRRTHPTPIQGLCRNLILLEDMPQFDNLGICKICGKENFLYQAHLTTQDLAMNAGSKRREEKHSWKMCEGCRESLTALMTATTAAPHHPHTTPPTLLDKNTQTGQAATPQPRGSGGWDES